VAALAHLHPNIELHIHRTDGRSPFDGLDKLFRMTGAPPRNPVNVPWFLSIYERAGAVGARAMLSGHKGNATVSQTGLRSLRDSAARGDWRRVWRETHALGRTTGKGRRAVLRREVVQPLTPPAIGAVLRRLRRRQPETVWDATKSAIHPEFARAMNVEDRVREANRHHDDVDRLHEMEFRLTVLAAGADVFDQYSGLRPMYGIETRDPTADRRVVEFCMAVPGTQYLQDGVSRSLIRRALAGRVPDQIRLRSSIGLQSADWPEWLPSCRAPIADELERLEASDTARRCLDLPKLRRLVDHWPQRLTYAHRFDYPMLLLRGVTMGRFIRWFEGTYA
jgi:asparagine synthase (glutamine-hydrolysing)